MRDYPQLGDLWVYPAFQPILTTSADRCVFAYEALLRGRSGSRAVGALDLLLLAGRNGTVYELDWEIKAVALRQAKYLLDKGERLFLNLDLAVVGEKPAELVPFAVLQEENIDPSRIVIEVTERATAEQVESFLPHMSELRSHGIQIALDDFGVGGSTFSMIDVLSPDYIKVDISMLQAARRENRPLTAELTALRLFAKSRGIALIIEGVETQEDYFYAQQLEVDMVQGFFLGRPMSLMGLDATYAASLNR